MYQCLQRPGAAGAAVSQVGPHYLADAHFRLCIVENITVVSQPPVNSSAEIMQSRFLAVIMRVSKSGAAEKGGGREKKSRALQEKLCEDFK